VEGKGRTRSENHLCTGKGGVKKREKTRGGYEKSGIYIEGLKKKRGGPQLQRGGGRKSFSQKEPDAAAKTERGSNEGRKSSNDQGKEKSHIRPPSTQGKERYPGDRLHH